MTFISKLPKALVDDIRNFRCLPIIGSGFSRNAIVRKGHDALPDWKGLAARLVREGAADGQDSNSHVCNPIEVISAFADRFGRTKLVEILHDIFWSDGIEPGKVHTEFAKIPFEVVCTTNYDFLLEDAYRAVVPACKPLLNETDLCMALPKGYVSLLKMHGDLNHPDRLVLTEEDYDRFVDENPLICTFLANQLIIKTPLFLGYSLEDADFRQVWQVIKSRLGKLYRRGYRLAVNDDESSRDSFRRRGITVVNLGGKNYEESYSGLFEELQQVFSTDANVNLSSLNSELGSALKEPDSRIVVFAIPASLVAFYRETIFPIVAKTGLVPVSFQELTAAMGSFNANLYTVIDKSAGIVVDYGAEERFVVFGFALKKLVAETILTIKIQGKDQYDLPGTAYILRPEDPYRSNPDDVNGFVSSLAAWLSKLRPVPIESTTPATESLSVFLLAWNEVIALLMQRYEHLPTRRLFEKALNEGIITADERAKLEQLIQVRNALVHATDTSKGLTASIAEITFLDKLAKKIRKRPKDA